MWLNDSLLFSNRKAHQEIDGLFFLMFFVTDFLDWWYLKYKNDLCLRINILFELVKEFQYTNISYKLSHFSTTPHFGKTRSCIKLWRKLKPSRKNQSPTCHVPRRTHDSYWKSGRIDDGFIGLFEKGLDYFFCKIHIYIQNFLQQNYHLLQIFGHDFGSNHCDNFLILFEIKR